MPFENRFARVFSLASVQRDAPACSGVYGLSNAGQWIYVGETGNIQGRLLELLEEKSTFAFLGGRTPTGFSFEICPSDSRIARQDRLVHELEPVINRATMGAQKVSHGAPERRVRALPCRARR